MSKSTEITRSTLEDVEDLLHHGYVEEDVFIGDCCLSFKTLSAAAEREIWMRHKNILIGHQVYFVIDLLSDSIHRVNGRRIGSVQAARGFLLGIPARLLLGLYRMFRWRLMKRIQAAQDAVEEYIETPNSKALWSMFKITGKLPSPDFDLRDSNIVQHLWCVVNYYRDDREAEEAEWRRSQFVADQICMFLDPKAFRQMKDRRDSGVTDDRPDHKGKEIDTLGDILEMMMPDDRNDFIENTVRIAPDQFTLFSGKLPQKGMESREEYKQRICESLQEAARRLEQQESFHAGEVAIRFERMTLDYFRERRARVAMRNLRMLLDIMGHEELEKADRAQINREIDIAISTRGMGYAYRSPDDRRNFEPVLKCEGVYKHAGFVGPIRRDELLQHALAEDIVIQVREIEPDVDAYLLRKANSEEDIGPRPPEDPADGDDPSGGGEPDDSGTDDPTAPVAPSDTAEFIKDAADAYRKSHPGVEEVLGNIPVGQEIHETLGSWKDTAEKKLDREEPSASPTDADEASIESRQRVQEIRREELETEEERACRREAAFARRDEAMDVIRRAKEESGVTPKMEREVFFEDIRRIAQGLPPSEPPDPPQSKPARPE